MAPTHNEPPLAQRAKDLEEDIRPGDVVGSGRWEILDAGTQGGMATVFRARDTRTGGEVALKVIAKRYIGRFDREKRFENEGRLAARLKGHRNIATPIETGVLADRANRMYLAMELVRGPTLLDFISMNGALPVEKACILIRDVARALRDLHAGDVVHRDLTSSNIIVVETSIHQHCAKVIDFGLAADVGAEGARNQRLTRVGELPGTPHYMAPEQVWGQGAHPTFDVYALGVVFYEMLTGEPPFHSMSDVEVKARKCDLTLPPPSLAAVRRDVPPALSALVTACLMPRYDERLPSSGAFVVQLDGICDRLGFVNPHAGESTGVIGMPRTIDAPPRVPKLKAVVAEAMAAKEARLRNDIQDAVTAPVAAACDGGVRAGITGETQPVTAAMLAAASERPREPTRRATAAESGQAAPRISGRTAPTDAATGAQPGHAPPVAEADVVTEPDRTVPGVAARGAEPDAISGHTVPVAAAAGAQPGPPEASARSRRTVIVATDLTGEAVGKSPQPRTRLALLGVAAGVLVAIPILIWWLGRDSVDPQPATALMAASPIENTATAHTEASLDGTAMPAVKAPVRAAADKGSTSQAPPNDDDDDDDGVPTNSGSRPRPVADSGVAPTDDGKTLPEPPDSPDSADPAEHPRSVPTPWSESRCAQERELAMADRLAGRFANVLTHTKFRRCWPNPKQRLELRVRAFSELGQYHECIKAGAGSTDAGVQRMVRRCRNKLGVNP